MGLFSCKPQNEQEVLPGQQSSKALSVEEAKGFFQEKILKNASKRSIESKSALWNLAYASTSPSGLSRVNVPIKFALNSPKLYRLEGAAFDDERERSHLVQVDFVAYKEADSDEVKGFVLKNIATEAYLQSKNYMYNERDFTGIRIFEDWEGNFIQGYKIENGQVVAALAAQGVKDKSGQTAERSNCTTIVMDIYERFCDDTGCGPWMYVSTQVLGVYCSGDPYTQEIPIDAGGGGGGSFDYGDKRPRDGIRRIVNELEDDCLKATFNTLLSKRGALMDELKLYFENGELDLNIFEDFELKPKVMGITRALKRDGISGIQGVDIGINPLLSQTSIQYQAEAMLHEFWHAILYARGYEVEDSHHSTMLSNPYYLQQTISTMRSIFPTLGELDIKAMFFRGFGDFTHKSEENRNTWLRALESNNITENDVVTIAKEYEDVDKGSLCP
jgi:hypothetical protein